MSARAKRAGAGRSRALGLLTAACTAPLATSAAQAQEVRFRATISWIQHEIEPTKRSRPTSSTYLVTLRGGRSVSEEFTRQYGQRAGQVRHASRATKLGEDMKGRFATQWTVINEHTLLRVTARPTHTYAIWLRTDDGRSCTVSAEWRLKPGFSLYETWAPKRGTKMLFSQPTDLETSCEVL